MAPAKINRKNLQRKCRNKGLTVTALAQTIKRSRPAIYFALENPRRYSLTYNLIQEALR